MRYAFMIALLFFSIGLRSDPIHIDIVSDYSPDSNKAPADLATQLLLKLEETLEDKLILTFMPASRKREWRELVRNPKACLYNKVKTPEREAMALFTPYPLMSFPANRLILKDQPNIPDTVSLGTIVRMGLNIGVSEGRSYGLDIDNFILENRRAFWISQGNQSAFRLRTMLSQGKLDGIIEYSSVFINEHPSAQALNGYSFHAIEEAGLTIFGYIACAKSNEGKRAVDFLQSALQRPDLQRAIISAHTGLFFEQEEPFILRSLHKAYNIQH
ncbi:ABC transporter substrate-binding protein [Pseudoalteromonas ardens]|uniref:ABC transporter substrate-binding protein n=1 Tax=Pseudoalteromonas rubra TaxID=43658 RepID=A0A0L0EVF5_9GAMM|nr:ABC transporter substrate-binding protein [Pseudoalteromonas sp. R96]KNC67843.1 ABC transporter substrate-binding protein [Pseudoalteromonas rubra]MDK1310845.1 ABC transporter substrate-binding protein [Pseudoalteromonas sp. R96]